MQAPPKQPPPTASRATPAKAPPPPPSPVHEGHQNLVAIVGDDPDYFLAELDSLTNELHGARLALANHRAHMARNESEFGSIGSLPSIWDHQRKVLLGTQIEWRRMQLEAQNELARKQEDPQGVTKITEQMLDNWAHQSEEYVTFIQEAARAREQYEKDRAEYDKLWAQVHLIEGKKAYVEARLRMIEEKMRFHRSAMNLSKG